MNNENSLLKKAIEKEKAQFETYYLWLQKNFPPRFFQELPTEWVSLIVHALVGFKTQDFFSEIHLTHGAITLCVDGPEADMRILKNYPTHGIKNYTTYVSQEPLPFSEAHGHLCIALLHFITLTGKTEEPLSAEMIKNLISSLQQRHHGWNHETCAQLINAQDPPFLRNLSTDKQLLAIEMFARAQTRDHCQYEVQYEKDWEKKRSSSLQIILAWKHTPKYHFLFRLACLVYRHHLVMKGVSAAYVNPYPPRQIDSILMLSLHLHGQENQAAWEAADIEDFLQELVTLKYFASLDPIEMVFVAPGLLRGNIANFLRSAVNFIHQILVNVDSHEYNIEQIIEGLCHHPDLTVMLCQAFEYKFHPQKHNYELFEKTREAFTQLALHLDTGLEDSDKRRRNILLQGMNFVSHILKCNFYRKNKVSLSFRMNPHYLDYAPFERKQIFPELPFAIFFIKGMHFIGFHIRFKDLARGGLRTIYAAKKEKAMSEMNTVFVECYQLALTQHKKNKDIPEGGAKGIILLKPHERLENEIAILKWELQQANMEKEQIDHYVTQFREEQKLEYLHQTQRSFVDSFLSIINCNDDGSLKAKDIVDYYREPEYIYLGPDENMHDLIIEWIAAKSIAVGYRPGGAFISGKLSFGINHKEFGVTSCGVNVYMHEILRYLGIDPHKDTFTVKITGGPDGDVAGNQIYNLYRYYPDTAKLIALTDVSGTIYDPEGLELADMVTLFKKGKPIRFYPTTKLHPGGFLLDRESVRETTSYKQETLCMRNQGGIILQEWLAGSEMNALFRNNVHQVQSDVFLPCGGRPRTLNETNYHEFLDSEGKPTAKAIIEGANLYLTSQARLCLEKVGVLIVKDSSANKCGVICSSFEILSGLALKNEEFLEYKDRLVEEILEKLQKLALAEATLLLKTHDVTHEPLSQISDDISRRIIFFTDQLLDYLDKQTLSSDIHDPFVRCFLDYCPKVLQEHFADRLLTTIPDNHKKAIIAAHIASHLVYERGLQWFPSIVDILPLLI